MFDAGILRVFAETAWMGFRLDLSAASYCVAPILLLMIVEIILKKQLNLTIYRSLLILIFTLVALITIADPELFRQWGSKFNNQVMVYISHPKEMAISTGSVDWLKTGLFLIFYLPILIFLILKTVKLCKENNEFSWQQNLSTLGFTALCFLFMRGGVGVSTISQASAIYSENRASNAAAVNSLWNSAYYILNNTERLYGKEFYISDSNTARSEFEAAVVVSDTVFSYSRTERPNVMIIMLESFTAGASEFFSGHNNCTPQLDRIAAESYSFTRCYAGGDRTEKGLACVNSGYPAQPLSSIVTFPDKVEKMPGLASDLKKQGYHSAFIYGGDAEFASMKSYLLLQGFDKIVDKSDFKRKDINSKWGVNDEQLYQRCLEELDSRTSPFYELIMSLSSHEPFEVPYSSPDLANDKEYKFKNSLRYADKCLGKFIEECKTRPWYSNTIIILVADHGHDIGLGNIHFFGKEKFHIPLIICGGALKPELRGVADSGVVSQTVIPALVLGSMGLPFAKYYWQSLPGNKTGFAQYHYNSGFGRVSNTAECIYDNLEKSVYFKGDESKKDEMLRQGKIFQQILVDDFLKK